MQPRELRPRQRVRLHLRTGDRVSGVVRSTRGGQLRLRSRRPRRDWVIPLTAVKTAEATN